MSELDHDRQDSQRQDSQRAPRDIGGRTPAEWTSLIVSSLALLAVLGPLVYLYLSGRVQPPIIVVTPELNQVEHRGEYYYLPVKVQNTGTRTAADVWVRLTHEPPEGEQETVHFQVGFLAGKAYERALVVFRRDPREGELEHVGSFFTP